MDILWGDEKTTTFITNVGLITTNGQNGNNIMACEWTHMVSYSPGMIAICINPKTTTAENLKNSKEFGVNITSTEQTVMASIAGGSTGKEIDKIKVLEELGFKFYKGKKIKTIMVKDAVLNVECKIIKEIQLGSHIMFVGEVIEASINSDKTPVAYHKGRYGKVEFSIPKPTEQEREKINKIVEKFRKN